MREVTTRLDVTFVVLMEVIEQKPAILADNQLLRGEKA
jgi:hypothetical protein